MRILLGLLLLTQPLMSFGNAIQTHEYKLENDLTLIVRPDHRAPIATVQVWYKVGSSYETNGNTGLSHFLEHMMFKGTPDHPGTTFTDTIYAIGGDLNAFAAFDYTGYYEILPTEYLDTALALEADRMQNLIMTDPDIFEKEKQVVLEERRMRITDQPISLLYERYLATAFNSSPYRVLPIGWHDDIAATTLHDIKYWYDTWYAPNNATVIIIGDVQPDDVLQKVKHYFEPIARKSLPTLKPQHEIKPLGQKRVTVRVPATLPYLLMGFHTPVLKNTPVLWEPAALTLLSGILDGGESARLSKNLIRGSRIANVASVDYDPYFRDQNLLTLSGVPAEGVSMERFEAALLAQIDLLKTELITPEELERARKQFMASEIYKLDSIDAQAYEIGSLESVGLSWEVSNEFLQEILLVTPEQVQQVAKKYLLPELMTVAILEPLALYPEQNNAEPTAPTVIENKALPTNNPETHAAQPTPLAP